MQVSASHEHLKYKTNRSLSVCAPHLFHSLYLYRADSVHIEMIHVSRHFSKATQFRVFRYHHKGNHAIYTFRWM